MTLPRFSTLVQFDSQISDSELTKEFLTLFKKIEYPGNDSPANTKLENLFSRLFTHSLSASFNIGKKTGEKTLKSEAKALLSAEKFNIEDFTKLDRLFNKLQYTHNFAGNFQSFCKEVNINLTLNSCPRQRSTSKLK